MLKDMICVSLVSLHERQHRSNVFCYVGTVNGPTSITRLGVWKMYQKVASFSFLDTPPKTDTNNFGGV